MLEHICEVCGRRYRKKLKSDGKIVCGKHYKQFKKYGYFIDNSPRIQTDKNEIEIIDNVAYMNLYNSKYEVVAKTKFDIEDIDKVKNIKWRLNNNGYVYNNANTSLLFHRVILGVDTFVDHINGDRLDNRKVNLRICTPSQNQMNVEKYKGYYQKNGKYIAYIKIHGKKIYLGSFVYEEEAKYARYIAERNIFKEFAYPKQEPELSEIRKNEIYQFVMNKIKNYN